MLELPKYPGENVVLLEDRYYDVNTGKRISAFTLQSLRYQLEQWNHDLCVDPPKGFVWYDEKYMARAMLIAHATGSNGLQAAKDGYGTNGYSIRSILNDAGLSDITHRVQLSRGWLTPEQVQDRLSKI